MAADATEVVVIDDEVLNQQQETDMTKKIGVRQGDVLVVPCEALPAGVQPATLEAGRYVLAHGEATGHHHSIAMSDRVAMFREDGSGSGLFLSVRNGPVDIVHQEHAALTLPPGNYRVLRQRVVRAGMARRVVD